VADAEERVLRIDGNRDSDLWQQKRAVALALATKVDRGEITKEDYVLQLQERLMQLANLSNQRNGVEAQQTAAANAAAVAAANAAAAYQARPPVTCMTTGIMTTCN
jgi:hypothetical protein